MLISLPFFEKLQQIINQLQQVNKKLQEVTSTESARIMFALVAT